jgi:excisionase family DNA binding protein
MTSQPPRLFFRLSESQQVLSLSTDTVERAVAAGELKKHKVGRASLISVAEAEAWVKSGAPMGEAKGE